MFASPTSAKLQEIGPRFTLKLRWLRKGLPAVTAADGSVPRGGDAEVDDEEIERQEQKDEDEAMAEMGKGVKPPSAAKNGGNPELGIPALDEAQEYEWKWKVSITSSSRTFADCFSRKWRSPGGRSSCDTCDSRSYDARHLRFCSHRSRIPSAVFILPCLVALNADAHMWSGHAG